MNASKRTCQVCVVLLMYCCHVKAMGLCEFEEMFPDYPASSTTSERKDTTTKPITTYDENDTVNPTSSQTTNHDHAQTSTGRAMTTDIDRETTDEQSFTSAPETNPQAGTTPPCGQNMKGENCVPPTEGALCSSDVGNTPVYYNINCTKRLMCMGESFKWVPYNCETVCEKQGGVYRCHCSDTSDGQTCDIMNRDCQEWYGAGFVDDDIYIIKPDDWPGVPFAVYCTGGWTVFQRRVNGSVDFYRNWTSYKEGFGSPEHEHWMGNEKLRYITKQKWYKLRIDLVDQLGKHYTAKYNYFGMENETNGYKLKINRFTGTAGDCLTKHRGMNFTTYDQGNDHIYNGNCAEFGGIMHDIYAWWYNDCPLSNLNGNYTGGGTNIFWRKLPVGIQFNITFTEMKIRPN